MPRVSAHERLATRARLVDAAKREFAERGLAGSRFDEISVAAGHAKGTIYNYFDSKEALFFTIVEEWCSLLAEGYRAAVGGERSAQERLRLIASLDVEIARKDPDLARVVVQHMPGLAVTHRAAVDAAIGEGVELLVDVIDGGLTSGEFASDLTAGALARLFLGAVSAAEMEALLVDGAIGFDDVVDVVDRHFVAGLIASP